MTTRWTRAIPILPALDLKATLHFYETLLGCRTVVNTDGYAGVERDGQQIHFWKCDDSTVPAVSGFRMEVSDIEELYEACRAAGVVHPNAHLEYKPWGFRQFGINDPDKNLLMFAQKL